MLVTVGDKTFGWGAEVRDLPGNVAAYGAFLLDAATEADLAKAIRDAGWEPSWKRQPTERVVFLCNPGAVAPWKQPIASRGAPGQTMQVVEVKAA